VIEFMVRTLLVLCTALAVPNIAFGLGQFKAIPLVFVCFALGISSVKWLRHSEQLMVGAAIVLAIAFLANLIWMGRTLSSLKKSHAQIKNDENAQV
jgi:hypothetical protein